MVTRGGRRELKQVLKEIHLVMQERAKRVERRHLMTALHIATTLLSYL